MEADLQAHFHTDIRDRWHPARRRRLTLRRLAVLIRHVPVGSAVMRIYNDGEQPWTRAELIAGDTWSALVSTKKKFVPYPGRPDPVAKKHERALADPQHRRRLAAARQRAAERARQIEAGEIT